MQKYQKMLGVTENERYLAKLAEKTFLKFWSWPNPHNDKGLNKFQKGKEICDLLVVCRNKVIIFSEKSIQWPDCGKEIAIRRWKSRAIKDSLKQVKGAERWLKQYPNRVFTNEKCLERLPLQIPNSEEMELHLVLICRGNTKRISLESSIKGDDCFYGKYEFQMKVGDLNPDGAFVHVVDEFSIDIIFNELDTISDFFSYLDRKEAFVRSGLLKSSDCEQSLLAYYSCHFENGEHGFFVNDNDAPIEINLDCYDCWSTNPQYLLKKKHDEESYFWDQYIDYFAEMMLQEKMECLLGDEFKLSEGELAIRCMAEESRYSRRQRARALIDALNRVHPNERKSFFRAIRYDREVDIVYLFVIVGFSHENYDSYREDRLNRAFLYSKKYLIDNPDVLKVVTIAREPAKSTEGVSEDLIYMEQWESTLEERNQINKECNYYNLFNNISEKKVKPAPEYPQVLEREVEQWVPALVEEQVLNRKERRRLKALSRRKNNS